MKKYTSTWIQVVLKPILHILKHKKFHTNIFKCYMFVYN